MGKAKDVPKCGLVEEELTSVDSTAPSALQFLPALIRENHTAYAHLLQYTPEYKWPQSRFSNPNPGLSFDCSAKVKGPRCEMTGRVFAPKKPGGLKWPVDQAALDSTWSAVWPNDANFAVADPRNEKDRAAAGASTPGP
jgi:hypothetical protein